jgi:hypothetical protein
MKDLLTNRIQVASKLLVLTTYFLEILSISLFNDHAMVIYFNTPISIILSALKALFNEKRDYLIKARLKLVTKIILPRSIET